MSGTEKSRFMTTASPASDSLDALAAGWLAGDGAAESALFENLRVRFLSLAKRRVREDHAEDVVQDALKIVHERYGEAGRDRSILVWGLTVLRNVIGNHYQKRGREKDRIAHVEDMERLPETGLEPDADLIGASIRQGLEEAVAELAERFPRCGKIFDAILASLERGGSPREISSQALKLVQREQPDLKPNAFYVALHRCRGHLRAVMDAREENWSHG
jgi:DNA-directed RNA polymerase specialized sigma24 family protein